MWGQLEGEMKDPITAHHPSQQWQHPIFVVKSSFKSIIVNMLTHQVAKDEKIKKKYEENKKITEKGMKVYWNEEQLCIGT